MFFKKIVELFLREVQIQKHVTSKITCKCLDCNCQKEFEMIETEELLNLIQHGRLNQKQIEFLKTQMRNKLCKGCCTGNHFR